MMIKHGIRYVVLAALGLSVNVAVADWPAYQRDIRRSAVADAPLNLPLREIWTWHSADPPQPAWTVFESHVNRMDFDYAFHPVVADGRLFIGSSADDALRAFDLASGRLLWVYVTGGPVRFAPQVVGDLLYAASDDGWVYCLQASDGRVVWKFRAAPGDDRMAGNGRLISRWPLRNGVLVDDGVLYTVAGMWPSEGIYVYALDADTGEVLWLHDTGGVVLNTWGGPWRPHDAHTGEFSMYGLTPQGPLLAGEKTLAVPLGNNAPAQFDKQTGALHNFSHQSTGGTWLTLDAGDAERFYRLTNPRDDRRGKNLVFWASRFMDSSESRRPEQFTVAEVPANAVLRDWKVSAVVRDARVYTRRAFNLALAGNQLIAGDDGAVAICDITPLDDSQTPPRASGQPRWLRTDDLQDVWRAPVNGRAYGLAIAGKNLVVSTDRGAIHVFGPRPAAGTLPEPFAAQRSPPPLNPAEEDTLRRLEQAGIDQGFALVLGDPEARLAAALAARTNLRMVLAANLDDGQAAALRARLLSETGLYGRRLQVVALPSPPDRLPFAKYFAAAVIVAGPQDIPPATELYRVLRPYGGTLICPGLPEAQAAALLNDTGATATERQGDRIVRGRLPRARDWDTPQPDRRVKWPLRPLWFGGPDLALLANYDIGVHPPIAAAGRYFVMGEDTLTAVDAYTGLTLWTRPIPSVSPYVRKSNGRRHRMDSAPANRIIRQRERIGDRYRRMSADGNSVYLTLGDEYWRDTGRAVVRIDARSGVQTGFYGPWQSGPVLRLADRPIRPEADGAANGPTLALRDGGDNLLVVLSDPGDTGTERIEWDLCFDLRPPDARYGLYDRGVFQVVVRLPDGDRAAAQWETGTGDAHPDLTVRSMRDDEGFRTLVQIAWAELEAISPDRLDSFGFAAVRNRYAEAGPVVQEHDWFGDRHSDRVNNGWAIVVRQGPLPAGGQPALIAGDYDESPSAWTAHSVLDRGHIDPDLQETPRIHPLTGEPGPRVFRSGTAACGRPVFSSTMRIGRTIKEALGLYDFEDDSGLRFFGGVSANCGQELGKDINMTAALGLLIFSDARVHCYCMTPFRTSFALAPAEHRLHEDWALFNDRNADTWIRQAHINLNAPGDRRDDSGDLWLAFPGSGSARMRASGTVFPWMPGAVQEMMFNAPPMSATIHIPLTIEDARGRRPRAYLVNAGRVPIEDTASPWIYTSGVRDIRKAVLDLNRPEPLVSRSLTAIRSAAFQVDDDNLLDPDHPLPSAEPMVVDGKLEDAGWVLGPRTQLPFTKADVFICHDDRNLYLAARRPPNAHDRMGQPVPWRSETQGENAPVWQDDSVEFFLSDANQSHVMHLGVSASGARYSAMSREWSAVGESAWDGAWHSAVVAGADGVEGLTIEIAVPWDTLVAAGLDRDRLSLNVQANHTDLSRVAPSYPPGDGWRNRMADPEAVLSESLVSLGNEGRERCANFVPLGLDVEPELPVASYAIRLHFAEINDIAPGERVFDIALQGENVLLALDIAREAGVRRALVKEFRPVIAGDAITVEFTPAEPHMQPILSAIEILRTN